MEHGQPTLDTKRLVLRPFTLMDAPAVQHLAGAREVAATTSNVPHPYADGMAEQWIAEHENQYLNKTGVNFAIVIRESDTLCGAASLIITASDSRAELGYWIGVPFWNQGYCTEAAAAVIDYGFRSLGLHRIHASHYSCNPASGRVMQKLGMIHEGCLRQHISKWGVFEDLEKYGILASEWEVNLMNHKEAVGFIWRRNLLCIGHSDLYQQHVAARRQTPTWEVICCCFCAGRFR